MARNLMNFSKNFQDKEFYNSGYASDYFFIPKSFEVKEYIKCSECGEVAGPVQTENFAKAYWAWNQGYQCYNGHWANYLLKKDEKIKVIEARAYSKNFIKAVNYPSTFDERARGRVIYSYGGVLFLSLLTFAIVNIIGLSNTDIFMVISSFIIPLMLYSFIWGLHYPDKIVKSAACDFNLVIEDNYSIFEGERFVTGMGELYPYNYVPNTYKYYFPMKGYDKNAVLGELNRLEEAVNNRDLNSYQKIIEEWGDVRFINPMNGCEIDHGMFTKEDLRNNSINLTRSGEIMNGKVNKGLTTATKNMTLTVNRYSGNPLFIEKLSGDFIELLTEFEGEFQTCNSISLTIEKVNDLQNIIEEYEKNSVIVEKLLASGVPEEDLVDYRELVEKYIKILKNIKATPVKNGLDELKMSKSFINDKYWSALND